MISAILFISTKGEVLISRYFRDNINRSAAEAFRLSIIGAKAASAPIVNIDKCTFLYLRQADVYVVAITKQNANAALVFAFLYKMIDVFRAYFGGQFDEENVRNNFVLIYELLDECMDHGYPQITAINILTSYIKHGEVKKAEEDLGVGMTADAGITSEITGNVDWRQAGKYRYRKNEVFIDVLEAVNLLMSSQGQVLRADVSGKIIMKTYLTGMPECFAVDQQILTAEGFMFVNDLLSYAEKNGGFPKVASLDPSTGHLKYCYPSTVFTKGGVHEMVEIINDGERPSCDDGNDFDVSPRVESSESNHVSLCVTKGHNVFVKFGKSQQFAFESAGSLLSNQKDVKILARASAGVNSNVDVSSLPFVSALGLMNEDQYEAFFGLYGYWLGDGSLRWSSKGAEMDGIGFTLVNAREKRYVRSLLDRLPLDGLYVCPEGNEFCITDKRWFDLFTSEYGEKYLSGQLDGHIDGGKDEGIKSAKWFWEWVWTLPLEYLRLIIEGLHMADGASFRGLRMIYTPSVPFRDQIVRLCLHAGFSPYFELHTEKNVDGLWKVEYTDDIVSTEPTLNSSRDVREYSHEGTVWCLEVPPHHLVIVRRASLSSTGIVCRASRPIVVGQCKFGMNDRVMMEKEQRAANKAVKKGTSGIVIDDISFHRCVKLGQFEQDRTINFIPPDGEFELMKYRITENVTLPFRVIPVIVEHGKGRTEYEIKVKGNFSNKLFASHVVLKIPTPPHVAKVTLTPGVGKAKYKATENAIVWKIAKIFGDASVQLRGEARQLHSMEEKAWSRPPITMEFQVPMFTSSGLHVRFLKVFERSNYETIKWVRYLTKGGSYQIRI